MARGPLHYIIIYTYSLLSLDRGWGPQSVATVLVVVVDEGDFEPDTTEERRETVRALIRTREKDEHMP